MTIYLARVEDIDADQATTRAFKTVEDRDVFVADSAQALFDRDLKSKYPNETRIGEIIDLVFEGGFPVGHLELSYSVL